jgi:hypothetical protein
MISSYEDYVDRERDLEDHSGEFTDNKELDDVKKETVKRRDEIATFLEDKSPHKDCKSVVNNNNIHRLPMACYCNNDNITPIPNKRNVIVQSLLYVLFSSKIQIEIGLKTLFKEIDIVWYGVLIQNIWRFFLDPVFYLHPSIGGEVSTAISKTVFKYQNISQILDQPHNIIYALLCIIDLSSEDLKTVREWLQTVETEEMMKIQWIKEIISSKYPKRKRGKKGRKAVTHQVWIKKNFFEMSFASKIMVSSYELKMINDRRGIEYECIATGLHYEYTTLTSCQLPSEFSNGHIVFEELTKTDSAETLEEYKVRVYKDTKDIFIAAFEKGDMFLVWILDSYTLSSLHELRNLTALTTLHQALDDAVKEVSKTSPSKLFSKLPSSMTLHQIESYLRMSLIAGYDIFSDVWYTTKLKKIAHEKISDECIVTQVCAYRILLMLNKEYLPPWAFDVYNNIYADGVRNGKLVHFQLPLISDIDGNKFHLGDQPDSLF